MPVTRFRDLQSPIGPGVFDNDTGAADLSRQLAESFRAFSGLASDVVGGIRAEQGASEGAAAGAADDPQLRTGLRAMTAFGKAYNNAATRSYAIKADAELENTAAQLEIDSANDPEKFSMLMDSVLKNVLKEAPAGTSGILSDLYNARTAQGVTRLSAARAQEIQAEQQATTQEGVEQSIDRIGRGIASDDPTERELAALEEVKVQMMIDSAQADGTFSETQAHIARKKVLRATIAQTAIARFRKELATPYGDPAGFILNLKKLNQVSEALPPDEEAQLENTLLTELREHNALVAAQDQDQIAEDEAHWAAGEQTATEMLLAGSLTRSKILQMVRDRTLKPAVARTLQNELESVSGGNPSDPETLFHVRTNLQALSEDEITKNRNLSWKDRADMLLEKRQLANTWRNTQQAREGADRIDRALGIVPGQFLGSLSKSVIKARDVALTEWYDRVDALPEEERQAGAIEAAEAVANTHIRTKARTDVELYRARKEAFIAGQPAVEDMSAAALTEYKRKLANYDRLISETEAMSR